MFIKEASSEGTISKKANLISDTNLTSSKVFNSALDGFKVLSNHKYISLDDQYPS